MPSTAPYRCVFNYHDIYMVVRSCYQSLTTHYAFLPPKVSTRNVGGGNATHFYRPLERSRRRRIYFISQQFLFSYLKNGVCETKHIIACLRHFFFILLTPNGALTSLSMRPLTQDESKAVFEKLANYIVRGSHLHKVVLPLLSGCPRVKI